MREGVLASVATLGWLRLASSSPLTTSGPWDPIADHIIDFEAISTTHPRNLRGPSPAALAALMREMGDDQVTSRAPTDKHTLAQGPTSVPTEQIGVGGGIAYLTDVSIGGVGPYKMVIDTGSSDTWVVGRPFRCLDSGFREIASTSCRLGPGFQVTSTFQQLPDTHFAIQYGDGEKLLGAVGTDTLKIGNLTIPNQRINVVDNASWNGDGKSSGLLGLGFAANTANYAGNIETDTSRPVTYDPVFTTAVKQGQIDRGLFAIAFKRSEDGAGSGNGGHLSFGGIPPVMTYGQVVETPLKGRDMVTGQRTEYLIEIDGFEFPGSSTVDMRQGQEGSKLRALVDSGTSVMLVPPAVAKAYNAGWNPSDPGSVPPTLNVVIGGVKFPIDVRDIKLKSASGRMSSAVMPSSRIILGDTFMRNVVSVFAVTDEKMRFVSTNAEGRSPNA